MTKREFTDADIDKICSINHQICLINDLVQSEATAWLAHYLATGGQDDAPIGADNIGDYEIQCTIRYSLSENDPAYNRHNEYANRIAIQDDHINICKLVGKDSSSELNWNEHVPMIGKLKDTWFCYDFHDLLEHRLHVDWNSLLRIGEIWLELQFIRQNIMNWDTEPLPSLAVQFAKDSIYLKENLDRERHELLDDDIAYAKLINDKITAGEAWIREQVAADNEWRMRRHNNKDGAFSDFDFNVDYIGILSRHHLEYLEDYDNFIVEYRERWPERRLNNRCRLPLSHDWYWPLHDPFKQFEHLPIARTFHLLLDGLDTNWRKMLSMGGLWVNVSYTQHKFISV